jgi:DNA-binding CsgD family transcriptional regulator
MDEATYSRLTPKERECLRVIGRDLSTEQIAAELNVSAGRAANLIKAVRAKLGGVDRYTAAARFRAYEVSLVGDVPEKDLAAPVEFTPLNIGRPDAGANAVREARTSFIHEPARTAIPGRGEPPVWLTRLVMIIALMVLICALVGLAYPVAEGWQHLSNLIDPPSYHT